MNLKQKTTRLPCKRQPFDANTDPETIVSVHDNSSRAAGEKNAGK